MEHLIHEEMGKRQPGAAMRETEMRAVREGVEKVAGWVERVGWEQTGADIRLIGRDEVVKTKEIVDQGKCHYTVVKGQETGNLVVGGWDS